ncbi:Cytochrome b561 and DOMON domain-containing protein [Quillaja saponaria]|uniref:Cytochrome b561 and DOMON domain-containing protein n=1 Tax=Quillaja saponaria TaxID=32244 RepID=A0AAD7KUN8_QUISA|nr:Cytochrome b561 and DOMON domain-containing protein [Quillaja saponaria]
MAGLLRLVLACSVLVALFFTSSAQTCKSYSFSDNREFPTCADLPQLNSVLHWNYTQASGILQLAYRHTGITSTGTWVAWAINPNNNLNSAMPGAQALVAILPSNGTTRGLHISNFWLCYTVGRGEFATCADLSQLNSFLHWNYTQASGILQLAYRHTGITSTGTWVAWAINPSNNLNSAMPGAQALVAILPSSGTPRAYTSPISGYTTQLEEGDLQYNVSGLTATYQNNEIIIFATMAHSTTNSANLNSKGTLNLLSGETQSTSGNSRIRKRNTHGVLNAVSWGVLMPIGALFARYLKVFKSADPAWFYLHVTCQASAYIIGVAGWGTGLKLGSDSVGIKYNTHRTLGIVLFCLGTLQVFALFLRPNKDHKFRFYWNIYHHLVGYSTIIISIINVFKGFDILQPDDNWKHAYIGTIAALGGIAVFLEAYTWIIVLQRKKKEGEMPHTNGANGVNGYARSQQA